jgi:fermentation-respiration switch protein FrsA (DUF1100 family)
MGGCPAAQVGAGRLLTSASPFEEGIRLKRSILAALAALAVVLAVAPVASAATTPFGRACTAQAEVRFCAGSTATRVPSFDGVPIDVDVTLPPTGDGPFPTIVMMHGWGGSKTSFETTDPTGGADRYSNVWFAKRGYAVVNHSARGWGNSCGRTDSRNDPGCLQGWIHLADQRFEAHDTQHLLGLLVDQGVAKRDALAVTGVSYGGGQSLMLAYLNDRTRMPDGSLVPWKSPAGTPLALAAAWPRWPWSDLVSGLTPNGRFLDFQASPADETTSPIGVPKTSYISGLFGSGAAGGFYSPPGVDPKADLTTWFAQINAGEPETQSQRDIAAEIHGFHSAAGVPLAAGGAAPLLIQQGWTDDLFPAPEALRAYNQLRGQNANASVALQFGDLGHARGQNKQAVDDVLNAEGSAFLDRHVLGKASGGPAPGSVVAFTQTCPTSAAAGGPFRASNWQRLHPGAVRRQFAEAQTVQSDGGDPQTAQTIDPISGGGACAQVADANAAGTAVYRLPVTDAFTLLGQPTIKAQIKTEGNGGQIASRLWDVGSDGKQTLVARGGYRLTDNQTGEATFQLYGNGWRFERGHTAKLELLGRDAPYLRASNTPFSVAVSDLALELPTRDKPGAGMVVEPLIGRDSSARKSLTISISPRRVQARRTTRFTVSVFGQNCDGCSPFPVKGAKVRFGGKTYRVGSSGQKRFKRRFTRRGLVRARASQPGYRSDTRRVRVVRAR